VASDMQSANGVYQLYIDGRWVGSMMMLLMERFQIQRSHRRSRRSRQAASSRCLYCRISGPALIAFAPRKPTLSTAPRPSRAST
jgi:hypothetical protein